MNDSTGPFVALAVLCQRYDRQPDGTADVSGIVDGLGFRADSPHGLLHNPALVPLMALVALRAGAMRGAHEATISGTFPSGVPGPSVSQRVVFTDDRPGVTLRVPLELSVQEPGTYWFDVRLDGRLLTRISLAAHVEFDGVDP
ncbi:MAG: hypothetical protein U0Q12_16060 [Vicinamibacterales bacterium]